MLISAAAASTLPVIGVTLGDEAGIGPEIIEAALQSGKLDPHFQYRVIGQRTAVRPGEPTPETARAARAALEEAARLAANREIDAVVTGPIHKARMQAIGFEYPGQTEFFAARSKTENFAMCLTGGALSVALVTAHLPLREVPGALREAEIIRVGKLFAEFLFRRRSRAPMDDEATLDDAGSAGLPVIDEVPAELLLHEPEFAEWLSLRHFIPPRIAVAGLNPHAGESGALGREEIELIGPAIAALQALRPGGASFTGPLSPDTVFNRAVVGEFDGVLCMYHDQGLIPLKLHAFDQGVNVTLGLPYPRTSPDHGTAFEIAGKNLARPESMIAALNLAADLARRAS